MCRWCHLPKLTPRYLWARFLLSECVLTAALVYVVWVAVVSAQPSQEYINATNTADIANLKWQINDLRETIKSWDGRLWGVLIAALASLGAQALNIRQNWKNGNGK